MLVTILSVDIEKRESLDETIKREIISTQNIDFRDVARLVANDTSENESFKVVFDEITNDTSINVDFIR